jgi:hypothetical protein
MRGRNTGKSEVFLCALVEQARLRDFSLQKGGCENAVEIGREHRPVDGFATRPLFQAN